jgi:hypothetical protein
VVVNQFELQFAQAVLFAESHDVLEDIFGTVYFGLLEAHLVFGEGVEGRREDGLHDICYPMFEFRPLHFIVDSE